MQLDFAFLARAGDIAKDGMFSVLGAGINTFEGPAFPLSAPPFVIVVKVFFQPEELDRAHVLVVSVLQPDGSAVPDARYEHRFSVEKPGGRELGQATFTSLIAVSGLIVPRPGPYEIQFSVDGHMLASRRLFAKLVPAEGKK